MKRLYSLLHLSSLCLGLVFPREILLHLLSWPWRWWFNILQRLISRLFLWAMLLLSLSLTVGTFSAYAATPTPSPTPPPTATPFGGDYPLPTGTYSSPFGVPSGTATAVVCPSSLPQGYGQVTPSWSWLQTCAPCLSQHVTGHQSSGTCPYGYENVGGECYQNTATPYPCPTPYLTTEFGECYLPTPTPGGPTPVPSIFVGSEAVLAVTNYETVSYTFNVPSDAYMIGAWAYQTDWQARDLSNVLTTTGGTGCCSKWQRVASDYACTGVTLGSRDGCWNGPNTTHENDGQEPVSGYHGWCSVKSDAAWGTGSDICAALSPPVVEFFNNNNTSGTTFHSFSYDTVTISVALNTHGGFITSVPQDIHVVPIFYGDPVSFATPTPAPTFQAPYSTAYCDSVQPADGSAGLGFDGFGLPSFSGLSLPSIVFGSAVCIGLDAHDFSATGFGFDETISWPGLTICAVPVSFGVIKILGYSINIDLLLGAMIVWRIIRALWRGY